MFTKTKIQGIKQTIVVASGKGGVGKSTVAAGMAISLAQQGHTVGLLDADIHGPSVPSIFHLQEAHPSVVQKEGKNRINPIIKWGVKIISIGFFLEPGKATLWRGPMVSGAIKQLTEETDWGELDYLIIDTPPGTGDIHMTLLQQYEITGAVIVTTPQKIALEDVKKAIAMFLDKKIGASIYGIIENMSWFSPEKHPDEKYYLFGKGGGKWLSDTFHLPLIARIPVVESLCESCDKGTLEKDLHQGIIKNAFHELIQQIKKS